VFTDCLGDSFAYFGDETRPLEFPSGKIVGRFDVLEFVVATKAYLPIKAFELLEEACLD
jgi:hypothetical protein